MFKRILVALKFTPTGRLVQAEVEETGSDEIEEIQRSILAKAFCPVRSVLF